MGGGAKAYIKKSAYDKIAKKKKKKKQHAKS